jgi:predicted nucleic acid-binding protein
MTSYVFDEVMTFFNSRGRHEKAVEVGSSLIQAGAIELVHVDEALFYEGWECLQKHKDKTYSLTDCISFIVMKKVGIKAALTFDRHFIQAGFAKLP